ncbi:four-carbon acid sugar kinase family protein [Brachybacterium sp. Z12]|uniref:four-carbon acid sugar kinase family protein n=1 Tax=Brachybacterium sp. Z12 TaxID=2759167 RepID=UPI00223B681A|nr:four-carbon acid sugar kinase family protein [Brachybacterium sp. Z12]
MTVAPSRRLLVLDDDPTGSQCVAGIDVAFDDDPSIPVEVLSTPGSACFVLTNTRALDEDAAVAMNRRIVGECSMAGSPRAACTWSPARTPPCAGT